jgi:high affinity Mn2+ porin
VAPHKLNRTMSYFGRTANFIAGLSTALFLLPFFAAAQNGAPASSSEQQTDSGRSTAASSPDQPTNLMSWLTENGYHNLEDESWNAYGQFTYISSWKPSFHAQYTNLNGSINSLLPTAERSFTGTATLFLGARLWSGGEGYFVPELISEQPFSQLRGLGAATQNFELQKGGTETPAIYHSRMYVKQTFELGGEKEAAESGPMQLGTKYDSRRIDFAVGNFSLLDFFDQNAFGLDPRQGFLSMGFMTYGAWDFTADARGYSYGAVGELFWDKWEFRFARMIPPKNPNQLPLDFRFFKYYGDQVEIAHHYKVYHEDGAVRLLAYRNHEFMGRFSDAIAAFRADPEKNATTCTGFNYGSNNANAPDLCWARKPNVKLGVGAFAEQYVAKDVGIFARAMYSDGHSEVDAYLPDDRSLAVGSSAKGSLWSRPDDVAGAGIDLGWISNEHAQYLRMGGVDGFIGDGNIAARAEESEDVFYSVHVRSWMWFTGDYQHITNPGFNAARGPVNVFTVRVHGEY